MYPCMPSLLVLGLVLAAGAAGGDASEMRILRNPEPVPSSGSAFLAPHLPVFSARQTLRSPDVSFFHDASARCDLPRVAGRSRPSALGLRCDVHSDDMVSLSKKALKVPATSVLGWREFRARLIQSETPLWMRRASLNAGVYAHEISEIEKGCVLIEVPHEKGVEDLEGDLQSEQYRVIFLVQYDEDHGSYGLILNRPTPCTIGDFTEKLPFFSESMIHFGGYRIPPP